MIRLYKSGAAIRRCGEILFRAQQSFHQLSRNRLYNEYVLKTGSHLQIRCITGKALKNKQISWDRYSNKAFTDFLEISEEDDFEQSAELSKLEEQLDKYEGARNSTEFQVINLMDRHGKVDMILDYVAFVRKKHELSPFTLYKAIESVTKTYPDEGLKLISECIQKMPVHEMGLNFLITIIKNLLFTAEWKYGLELFEDNLNVFTESSSPYQGNYIDSILAKSLLYSLINQDVPTYNHILNKYYSTFVTLPDRSQEEFLEHLQTRRITPDLYLEILKNYQGFGLNYNQVPDIRKEFQRFWGKSVNIELVKLKNGSSTCPACGEKLKMPRFTDRELQQLEEGFVKTILKSEHVKGWNPQQELDRFYECLWDAGPFDVVVDALNMMTGNSRIGAAQLYRMQEMMSEKLNKPKPKMLFITQRHKHPWKSYSKSLFLYSCNYNRSTDDLMVLLAALRSGSRTYFVSSDLYRDHIKDLSKQEFMTYLQWRQARQVRFADVQHSSILMPNVYQSVTQESEVGWHVPFSKPDMTNESGQNTQRGTLILPNTFMCVQKMPGWELSTEYNAISDNLNQIKRNNDRK